MSSPPESRSAVETSADAGLLPPWQVCELPAPRSFTFTNLLRTIGPGAILLVGSIGGGEWVFGPMMVVRHGASILWIATGAILLQMILNLEAVRYTMATGEPVLTGIMRLWPGPRFWGAVYTALGIAQLATPAIAAGCATVLFAGLNHREATAADASAVNWITRAVIIGTVFLLLSGKTIEKVLERASWTMIVFIFGFLVLVNVLFVPASTWGRTAAGFVTVHSIPEGANLALLAGFAALSGSGGIGNLAISNWFRDKGFAMGGLMGGIGGLLASEHAELKTVGRVFPTTAENLARWRIWWRYALADQSGLWAVGCLVGMFLNVNLASALIPDDATLSGFSAGTFQAKLMAEQLWTGFWFLTLLNGFWILYSTHLGNTDCLVRTVCDMAWAASPRLQQGSASRLYAALLIGLAAFSLAALHIGSVQRLLEILGLVACPITALSAIQILRVNTRFLAREIQPPLWRRIALVLVSVTYGGITVGIVHQWIAKHS